MASDSSLSKNGYTMNRPVRYKRKLLNFSVKREMQFKMIGRIFLLLFISLLLSSLIFFFFANREVTASYQMFHIKARNFLDFLLPVILGSFVISLVVGWLGSLFFPKPIAGAVYRIEQDLQDIVKTGNLQKRVKLRQGDQVNSLAAEVNGLLDDYQKRIKELDIRIQVLSDYFSAEEFLVGSDDLADAKQAVKELRAELKRLDY